MRSKGVVIAAVAVLVLGLAGAGLWWWRQQQEAERDRAAEAALSALATAWAGKDLSKAPLTDPSAATAFRTAIAGMGTSTATVHVRDVRRSGDTATAKLVARWQVGEGVTWTYALPVRETTTRQDVWKVNTPSNGSFAHPKLKAGDTMAAKHTFAPRADLLDRSGQPLMPLGTVYPVQLDPGRATEDTARKLEQLVDEPAGSLVKKLADAKKAKSLGPIPVITYRESDFLQRQAALDALKGVIYPKREQPLGRTRAFGQPLLGSFGPVTAEVVKSSKGRYAAGDYAGLSGLQGQYDEQLAGTPGVSVTSSTGATLFEQQPGKGSDVKTTLDPDVQEAAEKALEGTGAVPSAIVAVDVPSGDIVASANSPASGFNRSLTGKYPPGSTFKVATTYAYLTHGVTTPSAQVTCPKTFTVDGMVVKNFEGETLGAPTFAMDFAHSCNTAFVQLAAKLGDQDLTEAAKALGVGAGWEKSIGVADVFGGSIPANTGATDKAAAAIGQGRDEVSPASMAVMAASVARGSYVPPALVVDDQASRDTQALDDRAIGQLRDLMGLVVTDGTATVLRNVPGGPVHGKTGTAEHGSANPPQTHAWFVGYQGSLAFAVLVEEGRSGGSVAAPIAKAFLQNLS
jgi:cell division protein FtsI/penicillin-binding protein 2